MQKDHNTEVGGVFLLYKENIIIQEVNGVGKDCELVKLRIQA